MIPLIFAFTHTTMASINNVWDLQIILRFCFSFFDKYVFKLNTKKSDDKLESNWSNIDY